MKIVNMYTYSKFNSQNFTAGDRFSPKNVNARASHTSQKAKAFNQDEFKAKMGEQVTAKNVEHYNSTSKKQVRVTNNPISQTENKAKKRTATKLSKESRRNTPRFVAAVLAAATLTGVGGYRLLNGNKNDTEDTAIVSSEISEQQDAGVQALIDEATIEYKEDVHEAYLKDSMQAISDALNIPYSVLKLANNFTANGDPKSNLNLGSIKVPKEHTNYPFLLINEDLFIGYPEVLDVLAEAQENTARIFTDGTPGCDDGIIYISVTRQVTIGELKAIFGIPDKAVSRAKINQLDEGANANIVNKDNIVLNPGDSIGIKYTDWQNSAAPGIQIGNYELHENEEKNKKQREIILEAANSSNN